MQDLLTALGLMLLASFCVLCLTVRLTRPLTKRTTTIVGAVCGVAMGGYLFQLWGKAVLATVLPFSALVVWGNWFPLAAAFLAGITWTHGYGSKLRRVLFGMTLFGVSYYSMVEPLMGQPPECLDIWHSRGICLQTTRKTCSAAAAATLLSRYGIAAQESEMADLCLTRDGTTWQGLYRGLKLKTADRDLDVEVFECNVEELLKDFEQPAIIFVGLKKEEPHPRSYSEEFGWTPGIRHSVVLLDVMPSGLLLVADPTVGVEFWTVDDLRILWLGRGMRLSKRDDH